MNTLPIFANVILAALYMGEEPRTIELHNVTAPAIRDAYNEIKTAYIDADYYRVIADGKTIINNYNKKLDK